MQETSPLKFKLPSQPLVCDARVNALANINRWGGWLKRPYSVLEHSVIGTALLQQAEFSRSACFAFLLHDFEEGEFGDKITPLKMRHSSAQYLVDVEMFNFQLIAETGVDFGHPEIAAMDDLMAWAEHHTVAVVGDPDRYSAPHKSPIISLAAVRAIESGSYANNTVDIFWRMFNELHPGASANAAV